MVSDPERERLVKAGLLEPVGGKDGRTSIRAVTEALAARPIMPPAGPPSPEMAMQSRQSPGECGVVELTEASSNQSTQTRDCASPGQGALPEAIAEQFAARQKMVEPRGIEPLTSTLRTSRSPN